MIKILIIDDKPEKIGKIRECLDRASIVVNDIEIVSDIVEGKRKLRAQKYDILILDVQLPERLGDPPLTDGGLQILNLLSNPNRYQTPNYIIGLSEFDNLIEDYHELFEEQLHTLIKFDIKSDAWEKKLTNKVNYLMASKINSFNSNFHYDVGIVCALEKIELENILKLGGRWVDFNIANDNLIYKLGSVKNQEGYIVKIVAVSCEQMGMSATAVATTKLINHFRPKYIFMSGIAGAIEDSLNFGDIIVGDPCWDYGDGKFAEENGETIFKDSPYQLRAPINLLNYTNRIKTNESFLEEVVSNYTSKRFENKLSIHIGPLVSGSAVIATDAKKKEIKTQHRKIIAVDMEVFGFMYAAKHSLSPQPEPLAVKSISDKADQSKDDHASDFAAYTSAKFIFKLITDYLEFE